MTAKTNPGNYFEDFALGQDLVHATPRTVTAGDQALYTALYGSRFALASSDEFARSVGLPQSPLDDFLVFHVVFGKTVTGSATSEPPRPLRVVGDPKAPTTPKPRPDERSFAR